MRRVIGAIAITALAIGLGTTQVHADPYNCHETGVWQEEDKDVGGRAAQACVREVPSQDEGFPKTPFVVNDWKVAVNPETGEFYVVWELGSGEHDIGYFAVDEDGFKECADGSTHYDHDPEETDPRGSNNTIVGTDGTVTPPPQYCL